MKKKRFNVDSKRENFSCKTLFIFFNAKNIFYQVSPILCAPSSRDKMNFYLFCAWRFVIKKDTPSSNADSCSNITEVTCKIVVVMNHKTISPRDLVILLWRYPFICVYILWMRSVLVVWSIMFFIKTSCSYCWKRWRFF